MPIRFNKLSKKSATGCIDYFKKNV